MRYLIYSTLATALFQGVIGARFSPDVQLLSSRAAVNTSSNDSSDPTTLSAPSSWPWIPYEISFAVNRAAYQVTVANLEPLEDPGRLGIAPEDVAHRLRLFRDWIQQGVTTPIFSLKKASESFTIGNFRSYTIDFTLEKRWFAGPLPTAVILKALDTLADRISRYEVASLSATIGQADTRQNFWIHADFRRTPVGSVGQNEGTDISNLHLEQDETETTGVLRNATVEAF